MNIRYLDYNSTTPLAQEVFQAMEPFFLNHFGNPSSLHQLGRTAKAALRKARRQTANFLGAGDEQEIIFTSGGTESNNMAIRSALALSPGKNEMITSLVEHSSILKLCRQLEKEGVKVHYLSVDRAGQMDLDQLRALVNSKTALVSLMMANNETGIFFPYQTIGNVLRERGILFHVDGVQCMGKHPLNLESLPIDFFSLSAHKFYGPKGIGALYARSTASCQPLIWGGSQERGRRAGTENLSGIVGLGAASEWAHQKMDSKIKEIEGLRNEFENWMMREIPGSFIHGGSSERLCNTSSVCFPEVEAEVLLMALDQEGFCASSGSACMSGASDPSHVLKAMGVSDQNAKSSVRFSLGYQTTAKDIEDLQEIFKTIINRLKRGNKTAHTEGQASSVTA